MNSRPTAHLQISANLPNGTPPYEFTSNCTPSNLCQPTQRQHVRTVCLSPPRQASTVAADTPCITHSCCEELPLETVEAMHSTLPLCSRTPKLEPEQPGVEPRTEIVDRVGAHVLHAMADTLGEVRDVS